jgi:hypothetical protein
MHYRLADPHTVVTNVDHLTVLLGKKKRRTQGN